MRFRILGPLSITDGSDSAVLPPSKPTILLAVLLLHANTVVSAEYLQRSIWGEEQPATAKAALQTCVLRLRQLFTRHGVTETPVEAVPGGYRITAGPRALDLIAFREQVARAGEAGHDPEAELQLLKGALALWQGPLLANVRSDVLHRDEVPRLAEERLRTVERLCDLRLRLGHCGEALVELWGLTREHPGHERFREQLIEALYRTGRQAEALAEYRRIKEYLDDELGVEPSPALQRLELAILRGEDLAAAAGQRRPEQRATAPPPVSAGPSLVVPVPGVPSFTGRAAEVSAMVARLTASEGGDGEPVTVLVSGAPGIGKSALAHHVAHLVRDSFPAGRLLVRMVRPDGVPRGADEVAAELAAALDGRRPGERALLVLDDVVDADQVRPLLPAGPGSAAIVTSRMGLAGLIATHGGWVHRLSTFDAEDAYRLLLAVLGAERVEAEPEAVRRLAAACGHYPLALRIMAARLLTRPGLGLSDGVDWLAADPLARLSLADSPRMSVERVLDAALDRLAPRLAAAFVRIGSLPLSTVRAEDCAPVLGVAAAEAESLLEQLADAGFLEEGPPGPYRVHDLLRVYARRLAPNETGRTESPDRHLTRHPTRHRTEPEREGVILHG
ncbi:AfsR/SARP family transcriptional regulator [Streptomyces sp. TRM70350]|uniref:AfsR/SARP family transcriptional regulator n=1 Tax=Streptomyces sp. TRM70350 TaxID=2856165 RepID=UPI001C450B2C|nr:AfsR/SARP family transcriptional regulator [Streptomyces sp. TRM70350]MBV7699470.1 winged helix-turn-helix domain-containing protein [Streptomyces sp. TRM70350]